MVQVSFTHQAPALCTISDTNRIFPFSPYIPPIPHALAAIGFFSRDDHHREPMVKYRDHVWKVNLLLLEYFLQEYRACQRLSMDFPSIPRVSLKTEGWHPAMHQL